MTGPLRPDRRTFIIGGAMAAGAVLSDAAQSRHAVSLKPNGRTLDSLVPRRIGGWTTVGDAGLVVPGGQTGDAYYEALVTRTYGGAGLRDMMLMVAYDGAQDFGSNIHSPTNCYPAQGFTLSGWHMASLRVAPDRTIPGTSFTATRGGRVEQVSYWRRAGGTFETGWSERWTRLSNAFHGVLADGLLIRISTLIEDAPAAGQDIGRFATALLESCDAQGRAFLTGDVSAAARRTA